MSPYCALYTTEPDTTPDEIHAYCEGPGEVRLTPVPPVTRGLLLFTIRCDRGCHKTPPIDVLKADATETGGPLPVRPVGRDLSVPE
ncbi:MAG: hypothetical protein HOY76_24500 [Streptomyces sp.]|nr:hypothetical protein [Streptomyces sp.]NUS81499.1 hypothetical protein [Streptomyces sp.]